MDWIIAFIERSWAALAEAGTGLIAPALFFLFVGALIKGKRLFIDIRSALPETGLNLKILAVNLIFTMPVLVFASTYLSEFWQGTGFALFSPVDWVGVPPWLVIVTAVVVGDFVGYWRHRFEHNSFLWPAHAVHHSDTHLTWLSLERFHPINRLTTFLIDASALLFLGLPPYAVVANSLIRHYYGFFIHADIPWTYGRWNILFVSPAMHRWHHSADEVAHDRNFATVFGLWDWAFGTHYVPGPCEGQLGVTDPMEQTLWSQLTYALRPSTYARIFRRKGAGGVTPAE